ncbi:MAG: hypothetical protein ACRERU_14365 [Methylococcales bacterium]
MVILPLVRLAVLLVGTGTVSIIVDRRLRARKQGAATGETTDGESAPGVTDRLWCEVKGWSDRMLHKIPADFPPRFKAWAVRAAAGDTSLTDWLNALPEEGLRGFAEQLTEFCSEMGFDLSWLVDGKFDGHPELARAAERIVLHYYSACQQGAVAQEDLDVYKQLLDFERNPFGRKNRTFVERLFAKVVEDGLVAAKMSEYFSAPPKERQQIAVTAIREAWAKDDAALIRAVKEILSGPKKATEAP